MDLSRSCGIGCRERRESHYGLRPRRREGVVPFGECGWADRRHPQDSVCYFGGTRDAVPGTFGDGVIDAWAAVIGRVANKVSGIAAQKWSRFCRSANQVVDKGLHPLEPLWSRGSGGSPPRPLFVIGAPRTGSTVFYQTLASTWQVGYLNNFVCRYPRSVAAASRISRTMFRGRGPHSLDSFYGRTTGLNEPSECGEFWYRFFPRDPLYAPRGSLSATKVETLRSTVASIQSCASGPFVFKNLYCSLRIGALADVFPQAMFIWCRRNVRDCARSIAFGRQRINRDVGEWWSTKPPEFETLNKLSVADQLVGQIYCVERHIYHDIADHFGSDRLFTVQYEDFCRCPQQVLADLENWLEDNDIGIGRRRVPPGPLELRSRPFPDDELEHALEDAVEQWYPTEPSHTGPGLPRWHESEYANDVCTASAPGEPKQ